MTKLNHYRKNDWALTAYGLGETDRISHWFTLEWHDELFRVASSTLRDVLEALKDSEVIEYLSAHFNLDDIDDFRWAVTCQLNNRARDEQFANA